MRKERDGETTKEVVIAAAKEVFAERGFAGTSLAMISKKSGISDGLILYHFGSKLKLYQVVLDTLAKEYVAALSQVGEPHTSPTQAMQAMLQATFDYWSTDTSYYRISSWAYLENQTELIDEEVKLTVGLADAIRQMQAEGKVNPNVAPFVLLSMTLGPIQFWIRHRDLFKEALHLEGTAGELDQIFLQQYTALLQKVYQL
jgi:TetR/AcrR family transcriptional regulator